MAVVASPFNLANMHADFRVRYIDEDIKMMSPMTFPFINICGGLGGEAVDNPKIEWMEEVMAAETSLVVDNPLTNVATSLTVTTGQGVLFQVGSLLKLASGELVWVSAKPSANVLTIVRGVGGTTGAQQAAGTSIELMTVGLHDSTPSPDGSGLTFDNPYNYIQIFDVNLQVSFVQANTRIHGLPEGDMTHQMAAKTKQIMGLLEKALLLGIRNLVNVDSDGTPYFMGGLDFYAGNALYTDCPANSAATTVDAAGAPLTEKHLNDMLALIEARVGRENLPLTLVTNSWNARRINDIYAPYHRTERTDTTGGVLIDRVVTTFGDLDILQVWRLPQSVAYFINPDDVSVHPYEGLAFADYELPTDGAQTKRMYYGVYTAKFKNGRAIGKLYNLATS